MLGENIRKYRKEKNLSQDELAEKLNVTRQSVSLWENDQTQPSLENIVALAKLFGVTTDELLTDEVGEPTQPTAPIPPETENVPDLQSEQNEQNDKKRIGMIGGIAGGALLLGAILFFSLRGCAGDTPPLNSSEGSASAVSGEVSGQSSQVSHISQEAQSSDTSDAGISSDNSATASDASSDRSSDSSEGAVSSEAVSEKETSEQSDQPSAVTSDAKTSDTKTSDEKTSDTKTSDTKTSEAAEPLDLFEYFKEYVVEKGNLNGDYCSYFNTADTYGGNAGENFILYYWGDSDTVEFCLHCPLDDTYSVSFTLRIPKNGLTTYEYISSYYYRSDGVSRYLAKGSIDATKFTKNYPLTCSSYYGSDEVQNDFMEMSRVGICDLLDCLKQFLVVEKLDCSFTKDFGFSKF